MDNPWNLASAAQLGTVKIHQLRQLRFTSLQGKLKTHSVDQGNINRLKHRFKKEGCRRSAPPNYINALVSRDQYREILTMNSLSAIGSDIPAIILAPNCFLDCTRGRHRIAAASSWLPPDDIWWNVTLYDNSKLDDQARRILYEFRDSSRVLSDGEIFFNVRYYQKCQNDAAAGEWLAKWSPTKCRDFRQIYRDKGSPYKRFQKSLDELLDFPGIWQPWLMGTHLLSMQCPEELSNYLDHIYRSLHVLTCGHHSDLDLETIQLLEGRCPQWSDGDCWYINEIFNNGRAFSHITDAQARSQLHQAALAFKGIVPSLKTFLENTKYIKPVMQVMKKFLPSNFAGTIQEAMRACYIASSEDPLPIQITENDFAYNPVEDRSTRFWSAYRQMFLFATRNFYGLSEHRPIGVHKHSRKPADYHELWARFKDLANKVGFASSTNDSAKSSEYTAVHSLLLRLRPPTLFEYDEVILSSCTEQVARVLNGIGRKPVAVSRPYHSTDSRTPWSIERRCGMTDADSYFADQKYLFLNQIYTLQNDERREHPTDFEVKRDMFIAFFPGSGDL
ncbi:hypothetical protein BO86DRAFT_424327, partial [Aspergillus japonicus CBS 114.51]